MYRKILVPLDGSALAECALPHVVGLVKDSPGAEVTILNVFRVRIDVGAMAEGTPYLNVGELRETVAAQTQKYLAEVEARLASQGVKVKTVAQEGNDPAEAIAEYAQKQGMDLIVLATHGYTGMKKMMFGSVAWRVLHDSPLPLLLIRPGSCRT